MRRQMGKLGLAEMLLIWLVNSPKFADTLVEIGCRFSSTGNREMMPATAEKIEENIAEIANYLN